MGQLKWNYTPKMEPSILRILPIRTFSNMRSRSQHSTNLLTGLAPKRPLMASPPELDLLRASLRNSAADATCFYTKYISLRREVIKAHTFICIYIYISVIIMSRCICTNICTSRYIEVHYIHILGAVCLVALSSSPKVCKTPALPKASALSIPS